MFTMSSDDRPGPWSLITRVGCSSFGSSTSMGSSPRPADLFASQAFDAYSLSTASTLSVYSWSRRMRMMCAWFVLEMPKDVCSSTPEDTSVLLHVTSFMVHLPFSNASADDIYDIVRGSCVVDWRQDYSAGSIVAVFSTSASHSEQTWLFSSSLFASAKRFSSSSTQCTS